MALRRSLSRRAFLSAGARAAVGMTAASSMTCAGGTPQQAEVGAQGLIADLERQIPRLMADTALIPNPDVNELAAIALDTGKLALHFLGRRPLVAMLSHSTKGSATTPDAQRMSAATALAKAEALKQFLER